MANTPLTAASNTGLGTISYNGLTFNSTRAVKITATPIYDQSQRTVTHLQYQLQVHGFIAAATEILCATSMQSLQDALTQPGGTLTIDTIGFDTPGANPTDTFTTNATGTFPDLMWGAKPRLLSMEPVGGNIGWEFTWECEFNVSRAETTLNQVVFLAFNYEWSVTIDQEGLTTRTIAGYAQIPAIRGAGSSRSLLFNVDNKWDNISAKIPYGFRRLVNQRRINDARNRIDFVLVDQELAGEAFPDGMVHADVRYSFENIPPTFIQWRGTISGTMTAAPGIPPWQEAAKFFLLAQNRISLLREAVAQSGPDHWVLPETLSFSRNLFGRGSQFSISFRVIGCLRDIVGQSGVFTAIGTDWQQWADSMQAAGVFANRGRAGLRFRMADDYLIDPGSSTTSVQIGTEGVFYPKPDGNYSSPFSCDATPEKSWIGYENRVQVIDKSSAVIHSLSKSHTPSPPVTADGYSNSMPATSASESEGMVEEYTGQNRTYLLFVGKGMRLKFHPSPPSMTQYNGVPVVELARNMDVKPYGNWFGCPAFIGRWAILYLAKGSVSGISASGNPAGCYVPGQP